MKKYTKHVTLLALTFLSFGQGAGYAAGVATMPMGAGPYGPSPMMSGRMSSMEPGLPGGVQALSEATPISMNEKNPYCEFKKKIFRLRYKGEYAAMDCARTLHSCLAFAHGYWKFKVKEKQPESLGIFSAANYDNKLQRLEQAVSGDKQACFADRVNFVKTFCVGDASANYCKNDLVQMACSIVTKNPEAFVASGDHSDVGFQDILDNAAAFAANKKSPEAWAYLPENATLLSNAQAWVRSKNAKLAEFGSLKAAVAKCFVTPGFLKNDTKRKTAKDYMMQFGFKLDNRVGVKFTKKFDQSGLYQSTGTGTETRTTNPDGSVTISSSSQSQGTLDTSWRF